jgi:hypothetical protein
MKQQLVLTDKKYLDWRHGATRMHMMAWRNGLTNIKKTSGKEMTVTVGNGNIMKTLEMGDLPGIICNT